MITLKSTLGATSARDPIRPFIESSVAPLLLILSRPILNNVCGRAA
jgi:hypothetical protein